MTDKADARQIPTGAIGLNDIVAEFSGTLPHGLTEYTRGGAHVPSNAWGNIPSSAPIGIAQFRGAVREFVYEQTGDWVDPGDLRSVFNSTWFDPGTTPVRFRFIVRGRIAASTPDRHALYVGAFPAGSTVTIENRGEIYGAGGRPNGGWGSGCIAAHHDGFETVIENFGRIWAGGGAGGYGGAGGGGYYQNTYTVEVQLGAGTGASTSAFGSAACTVSCTTPFGGSAWCAGSCY
jgi:hypothetical protein